MALLISMNLQIHGILMLKLFQVKEENHAIAPYVEAVLSISTGI